MDTDLKTPELSAIPLSPEQLQVLDEPWYIESLGYTIHIDRGFQTDGASIPRFFWSCVGYPFEGDLLAGAVTHDGLYQSESLSRDICDDILKDIIKRYGVGSFRAWVIWSAVRLAGGIVWKHHTPESIAQGKQLVKVTKLEQNK